MIAILIYKLGNQGLGQLKNLLKVIILAKTVPCTQRRRSKILGEQGRELHPDISTPEPKLITILWYYPPLP